MTQTKTSTKPAPKAADKGSQKTANFAISPDNYKYILLGLGLMVLGCIFMLGGGSDNPDVFNGEKLFSFTRITLSTVLIVAGFAVEVYAIMRKPKETEQA